MNEKKPALKNYASLLTMRKALKDFQQYSWNIAKIENTYPIETLNADEVEQMLGFYFQTLDDVLTHFVPKLKELRDRFDLPETPRKEPYENKNSTD